MTYEITIGIPIYNKEKYIALTLETALAQTYQSIEFLVLDDRGTDGSMDVVREYQQTHPACWCKGFPVYDDDGVFKRYVANVLYILIPKDFVLNFAG